MKKTKINLLFFEKNPCPSQQRLNEFFNNIIFCDINHFDTIPRQKYCHIRPINNENR